MIPLGNGAATLSAYGIAAGDLVQHHEVECRARSPLDPAELQAAVDQAEDERAEHAMPGSEPELRRVALMRYAEQLLQSVPVPIADGPIDEADLRAAARRTSTPSTSVSSARSRRRCSRRSRCSRCGSRRASRATSATSHAQPPPDAARAACGARCPLAGSRAAADRRSTTARRSRATRRSTAPP